MVGAGSWIWAGEWLDPGYVWWVLDPGSVWWVLDPGSRLVGRWILDLYGGCWMLAMQLPLSNSSHYFSHHQMQNVVIANLT